MARRWPSLNLTPNGLLQVALIATGTSVFILSMAFLYLGMAAFGVPPAWGAAIAAPIAGRADGMVDWVGTPCFRWFILPASLNHALVASFVFRAEGLFG